MAGLAEVEVAVVDSDLGRDRVDIYFFFEGLRLSELLFDHYTII